MLDPLQPRPGEIDMPGMFPTADEILCSPLTRTVAPGTVPPGTRTLERMDLRKDPSTAGLLEYLSRDSDGGVVDGAKAEARIVWFPAEDVLWVLEPNRLQPPGSDPTLATAYSARFEKQV
jgi:hypothetical protein